MQGIDVCQERLCPNAQALTTEHVLAGVLAHIVPEHVYAIVMLFSSDLRPSQAQKCVSLHHFPSSKSMPPGIGKESKRCKKQKRLWTLVMWKTLINQNGTYNKGNI